MAMRKKRPPSQQTKELSESAAKQEVPFEGKEIGRAEPSFRGSEQQGPGMNKGRGSAGSKAGE
jgi:hypothetical protein